MDTNISFGGIALQTRMDSGFGPDGLKCFNWVYISEDPIGFSGGDYNLYRLIHNNPSIRRDPLGLMDWFFQFEGDLVPIIGQEGAIGVVIDFDNLGESGLFVTHGIAIGANAGIAVSLGFAVRDIEGYATNTDLNVLAVSPVMSFDDQGFNGIAVGVGPGIGAAESVSNTTTYTLLDLLKDIKQIAKRFRDKARKQCKPQK